MCLKMQSSNLHCKSEEKVQNSTIASTCISEGRKYRKVVTWVTGWLISLLELHVTMYIYYNKQYENTQTSKGESGSSRILFSLCIRCIVPVELGSIISTF